MSLTDESTTILSTPPRVKSCTKCNKVLPYEDFILNPNGEYRKLCKVCTDVNQKRKRNLFPEKRTRKASRLHESRSDSLFLEKDGDDDSEDFGEDDFTNGSKHIIRKCIVCVQPYIRTDTKDDFCIHCNMAANLLNNDPMLLLKLSMTLAEKKVNK